jgi:hypothetical protein
MQTVPHRIPELSALQFPTQERPGMEPCPRCNGVDLWPEVSFDDYGIYCATCDWVGPRASPCDGDPDAAWAAWNREARQVREARDLGLTINLVQPVEEDFG